MKPKGRIEDEAVFTLTFKSGLADRNRLPVGQVLRTLTEFQELVRQLGRRIQAAAGIEDAVGDFGLEIAAAPKGALLKVGSVVATVIATKDVENARKVFGLIVSNTKTYSRDEAPDNSPEGGIVARHMLTMAKLQVPAKSLVAFHLQGAPASKANALLDEKAYLHLVKARRRLMRLEGLQLYGKLRELKDRSKTEREDGRFWGELIAENGEVWRLRFGEQDLKRVLPLFKRQVAVRGDATYFGPARHPRLVVRHIEKDQERNYVAAFDAVRSSGTKYFGNATTEEILEELYA